MIVVGIVGILAAVAIPALMKYVRKSKTAEAVLGIQKISVGARTYLLDENVARGTAGSIDHQFPNSAAMTPPVTCCGNPGGRCVPNPAEWATPEWGALKFAQDDPHYYQYEFISSGVGPGSTYTARAQGDLDCDGTFSTFEMVGEFTTTSHDMTQPGGVYRSNELE
jgi:type IV pilus assembly protein PilA